MICAALFLTPLIAVFFRAWPAWETQYWCQEAEKLRGDGLLSLLAGPLYGRPCPGSLFRQLAVFQVACVREGALDPAGLPGGGSYYDRDILDQVASAD